MQLANITSYWRVVGSVQCGWVLRRRGDADTGRRRPCGDAGWHLQAGGGEGELGPNTRGRGRGIDGPARPQRAHGPPHTWTLDLPASRTETTHFCLNKVAPGYGSARWTHLATTSPPQGRSRSSSHCPLQARSAGLDARLAVDTAQEAAQEQRRALPWAPGLVSGAMRGCRSGCWMPLWGATPAVQPAVLCASQAEGAFNPSHFPEQPGKNKQNLYGK